MGRKNDVWSSPRALGLRRTGIQVWAQHVATGVFPSFRYYPQTENLNGGVPIAIKRYPTELPEWPSGMLFDHFEQRMVFGEK